MSSKDRIWREGDEKWVWLSEESVPRYMWSQIHKHCLVDLLNKREWQLIETAPKDGDEILTCDTKSGDRSVRYWGEGEDGDMAWQPRIRGCFPTHWMPVPTPPKGD